MLGPEPDAHHGAELFKPDHPAIRKVQRARVEAVRRALRAPTP